jgi:hypothetical protein
LGSGGFFGCFQGLDGFSLSDVTCCARKDRPLKRILVRAHNKFLVGGKDGYIKTFDGTVFSDESGGWDSTDYLNAMDWSDSYSY